MQEGRMAVVPLGLRNEAAGTVIAKDGKVVPCRHYICQIS
jgi:hypothetical protein